MYCLAIAFIHRNIFEFVTSYGDISQTASVQLDIFLHMLHQRYNFYCINTEHIIELWQIPTGWKYILCLPWQSTFGLPHVSFPLTYIYIFLFSPLTKLFFDQCTVMFEFERFGNNDCSCDRCFFPSQIGKKFQISLSDW